MDNKTQGAFVRAIDKTIIRSEYARLFDIYTNSGEEALLKYLKAKWKQHGLKGKKT